MLLFFVFIFLLITPVKTVLAFTPPVIIDSSKFVYPITNDKLQDYPSNNALYDSNVTFSKTFTISQSFNPICASNTPSGAPADGQNSTSGCTFVHQTISQVNGTIGDDQWTNWGLHDTVDRMTNNSLSDPYASKDKVATAFVNYNIKDTQTGSLNSTARTGDYTDLLCGVSRRIDEVVKYLNCVKSPGSGCPGSLCNDEVINNSGIRFGRAIVAYSKVVSKFYYPNCKDGTQPTTLPGPVLGALYGSQGEYPSDAVAFFNNNILPMGSGCNGSSAMLETQCNLSATAPPACVTPTPVNMPLGDSPASTKMVALRTMPAGTVIPQSDPSEIQKNASMPDRPNPTSWGAFFSKLFWDAILEVEKSFSGPTQINYGVPISQTQGLDAADLSNKMFLPSDPSYQPDKTTFSSTDGKTGVNIGLQKAASDKALYKVLTPCSWQGTCSL